MMKALIFLDGETCKVVFGTVLKCFPMSDHAKPEIDKFLDKIFSTYDVRVATSTAKTDKAAFVAALGRASGSQAVETPSSVVSKTRPTQTMVNQIKQPTSVQAPDFSNINWLKSVAATTIVIDDLLTNQEVRPGTGIRKAFVISPGMPSNLLGIDQQVIRQSRILANLLRNGTLIPISQAEAFRMQNEYDAKMREEQDDILDDASPIVDRRSVIENGMNTSGHDVPPLDLTNEIDLMPTNDSLPNEGQGTMSELIEQMTSEEPEPQAEIVEISDEAETPAVPQRVAERQAIRKQQGRTSHGASAIRKRIDE
jgi:hypothetical protein